MTKFFVNIVIFVLLVILTGVLSTAAGEMPESDRKTLPNGLAVILVEDHRQPVISVQLLFKTGAATDVPEKSGLCNIATEVLPKGSKNFGGDRLRTVLDSVGGNLNTVITRDASGYSGFFRARDLSLVLRVLSDMVINPEIEADDVENIIRRFTSIIIRNRSVADYRLDDLFYERQFSSEGFGLPEYGTVEGLEAITVDDVKNYYDRNIRPNNAVLVVAGDFDRKSTHKLMRDYFSDWPTGQGFPAPILGPSQYDSLKIIIVDNIEASTSGFLIGGRTVPIGHEVGPTLFLLDYMLGYGGSTSRLGKRLAGDKGPATTARSEIEWWRETGCWFIRGTANSEMVVEAIREALAVIDDLRQIKVAVRELEDAKAFYRGIYPRLFETPASTARTLARYESNNLPVDHYDRLLKEINQVTPHDVREAAREFLNPDNMIILIDGPAGLIKRNLSDLAEIEVISLGRE
jgi:predicted Zn-dependent peptidase